MIKETVAYCGLFCESCGVYIATQDKNNKELERLADLMKTTKDEIVCNGCRSSTLSPHCRKCNFRSCSQDKNNNNCEDCNEFPCSQITEFQKQMPHRAELFESLKYRKEHGINDWLIKMKNDYACSKCETINSPYYIKCKKCNTDPGNDFIERNYSLFKR